MGDVGAIFAAKLAGAKQKELAKRLAAADRDDDPTSVDPAELKAVLGDYDAVTNPTGFDPARYNEASLENLNYVKDIQYKFRVKEHEEATKKAAEEGLKKAATMGAAGALLDLKKRLTEQTKAFDTNGAPQWWKQMDDSTFDHSWLVTVPDDPPQPWVTDLENADATGPLHKRQQKIDSKKYLTLTEVPDPGGRVEKLRKSTTVVQSTLDQKRPLVTPNWDVPDDIRAAVMAMDPFGNYAERALSMIKDPVKM